MTWHELYNTYRFFDQDVLLINSHGLRDYNAMKIHQYDTCRRNNSSNPVDGIAIAIRNNMKHKTLGDLNEEVLAIGLDTPVDSIKSPLRATTLLVTVFTTSSPKVWWHRLREQIRKFYHPYFPRSFLHEWLHPFWKDPYYQSNFRSMSHLGKPIRGSNGIISHIFFKRIYHGVRLTRLLMSGKLIFRQPS